MTRVPGKVEAARTAALRFFGDEGGPDRDRLVMARALGSLFVAGGLVGLVSLALPHEAGTNVAVIAGLCGVALVVGIAFALEDGRLPAWAFPAASYGAVALIASAVYFSDDTDTAYALYFVLVAVFAAYFLSLKHLVLVIGSAAVLYPIVVGALGGGDESAQRWLLTIWTMIVVAAFISILRRRMRGLIARLFDAARTDPLTDLLNRRGFADVFDLELERSRRSGRP